MYRLSKLVLVRAKIVTTSLAAFDDLFCLKVIEFVRSQVDCEWSAFGACLARTPVKSVTFRSIDCQVEDIESFLAAVKLDYFYISNFTPALALLPATELFHSFGDAFHCKRDNPRKSFLIEQDGCARNHNGVITRYRS
jgi:hypothetical protein